MYKDFGEKIDIVAIFGKNFRQVKPFRMKWKGREYTIQKVDYVHRVPKGNKVMYHFACWDGVNHFEIAFDTKELAWFINKVWYE